MPTRPQDIEVTSCTLGELFSGSIPNIPFSKCQLFIPEYQRPYLWGAEQLDRLIQDFETYFRVADQERPLYYLGSIILHWTPKGFDIIDGQQRITTMAIIAHLLEQETVLFIKYSAPLSIQNIQKNHVWLQSQIKKLKAIDFSKINVTLIIAQQEDDAYTFFETQNTGGVRLSGTDILKAHHLRAIQQEDLRGTFALNWEAQKHVDKIVSYLLKARYWNTLRFKKIPSHRDQKGRKQEIIREFRDQTLVKGDDLAYKMITVSTKASEEHGSIPTFPYAARQPLNNGINFINYLSSFSSIYLRLFVQKVPSVDPGFYRFREGFLDHLRGSTYLKDFFELAMLLYVSKYGTKKIYEPALWIFRYTYSLRLINQRTVREDSVPAFIQKRNYLFDEILYSFTAEELLNKLVAFTYEPHQEPPKERSVKWRFISAVKTYFKFEITLDQVREKYDNYLVTALHKKELHE